MIEMVCIICPNGCSIKIENDVVKGNRCEKGKVFAIEELKTPRRTLTTTVKTIYEDCPVLPVKINGLIPKEKIFECIKEINKITISKRLKRGDIIIKDMLGMGVDLIVTSSKLIK